MMDRGVEPQNIAALCRTTMSVSECTELENFPNGENGNARIEIQGYAWRGTTVEPQILRLSVERDKR